MATFKIKVKNQVEINKKPRVYFTCHPEDFEKHFEKICEDIFKTHDCAIYYTEDMKEAISDKEQNSVTNYYNLDAIISVGYRIDSVQLKIQL